MQNRKNVNRQDIMIEEQKAAPQELSSDEDSQLEVRERKEKGFEEEDCESDYEDQLDNVRRMKR